MIKLYTIANELKDKIVYLNKVLSEKYSQVLSLDEMFLREFIEENVGPIRKVNKLTEEELAYYYQKEVYWE